MILLKIWAKHKVKSYLCVCQFLREKRCKKWKQECKQKQPLFFNFCNKFDLLTSRTQKIAWWPPCFSIWFLHIFLWWTTQENLKKFHQQLFIVSHLLKVRSWISQLLKPDNIWICNILKHLKIFNFRAPLNFTWIIIAPFILT